MKVLHVFPFLSIKRGGGATWLITEIAKAQSKYKTAAPTIISGDYMIDNELVAELSKSNVNVIVSKSFFNKISLHLMPSLIFKSYNYVKRQDIIHFHVLRTFQNIFLFIYAIILGKSIILDAHGSLPRHSGIKIFKKILFDFILGKWFLKKTDLFIAENEMSLQECLDYGAPKNKIIIVRPPFPVNDFDKKVDKNYINSFKNNINNKVVLFFGRLHKIKGIDLIIKGFKELYNLRKDVELFIMGGDEGELDYLQKLCADLNVKENVKFLGYMDGDKKLSIIKSSNMCVQSSRYEQGAGAPFESVLCETPILVSDNSGCALDVQRIDAGYLFEFNNHIDFSKKANFILNNKTIAKTKTIKAKKRIQDQLSFEKNVKNYKKAYELATENK